LAEKILTSRAALEGERKHVTVLFADVKGSMDLAEQVDPEEWHKIMDRFFAILGEGVHRFEGTINQYTGDGIMALFGAPIAHEDHARRACLAVLHLREALRAYADEVRRTYGMSFAARMGLNSGEVVVGRIGDDLRMDYTAQGHTVGLAQRMEQLAEPGGAYLTAHTAHLVQGYVGLRSLGKVALKGVNEALDVYALEGLGSLRNPLELSRSRGFSKFVGRAAELATLEAALERGLQGRRQTVFIVADAGTGKSRLCFEFAERCRSQGFKVLEARGVAHGRRVPLLPMLELFRAYFGVEAGDEPLAVREKIAGRLLLLDESLRDDLPIFFNLLEVPDSDGPQLAMDPEVLQRRAYAAVRAIARADGQREKPAILLFEDLHWLDAASDGYLAQIIEATETTRGLALVNFRPEYRATWMQAPSFMRLPLAPLGEDAVRELLADLLGNDASVSGLAALVHQRAGGNPFFVKEIVQTLVETGALQGTRGSYRLVRPISDLVLPATVQAVLAARIDRLEEREKRLLQQVSVIGKKFSERVVRRICGLDDAELQAAIRVLRDSEFLYEESLYPHVAYAFKHPLTQEVADRSQLKERRAETHAAVARAIEKLSGDRLDEEAALIAHHWEEAGENRTAAQWHARSARWIGLKNYTEAFAHWRRVITLIGNIEGDIDLIQLRVEAQRTILMLGYRVGISENEAAAIYAAGQRDLQKLGDDATLALLMVNYAALRQNAGAADEYSALVVEANQIAARSGDRAAYAAVGPDLIFAHHHMGRLAEAWIGAASTRRVRGSFGAREAARTAPHPVRGHDRARALHACTRRNRSASNHRDPSRRGVTADRPNWCRALAPSPACRTCRIVPCEGKDRSREARAHRGSPLVRRDGSYGARRASREGARTVNRASCGHENPAQAKFCLECGGRLGLRCAACNAELPRGAKFCLECGKPLVKAAKPEPQPDPRSYTPKHLVEKILTSRSALEGERKQVTVLFADVKGSMDLAEQIDPEEWHKIMDRFFAILSEGVHRFEGTINQYTGDGIMALFGAPIAHEDHARRASYAALHLNSELRRYAEELKRTRALSFLVRMGLNSGEVVVGKIGDDLRMDYTAQGHTVGLASRMEQLAEPGRVYLTEETAKLVSGFFRLRDLGPFELKGTIAALRVYELEGVSALRTPIEVSRSRGFSRFVGRADEMAAFEAALGRAVEGNGQVVGVVAHPGFGKSRLCFEFAEHCRARGITVYEAHGVSHGKLIPFLPILELFRAFFRITDHDGSEAAREKIAGRMLLLDDGLKDAPPLMFDFLEVPDPERPLPQMDPQARLRQLFGVVKRIAQARSKREPAVVLLEDLHWFDGGSDALLEVLVDTAEGTRTLIVVNFRPEYHASWMKRSYYQQLPLLPLGQEAIAELLRDLLGTDASVASLGSRIRERTGGVPFFIEEIVQSLAEAGSLEGKRGAYRLVQPVAELTLLSTVQAVLAARVDRLEEREKQVLQTAAVIGRQFTEPILRRVVELPETDLARALDKLAAAEFIFEQALYPQAEYIFKHALTQEVAYNSLLIERRQTLHERTAETIEALVGERPEEHWSELAHHYSHSRNTQKAIEYSQLAGERGEGFGERGGDQSPDHRLGATQGAPGQS
jgi:predicted ATPase/class 3 adenylate cyclase